MRRALGFLGRRLFSSNNAKSSVAKVKESPSLPEKKKPTMLGSVREVLWRRKTITASIGVAGSVSIFIAYQVAEYSTSSSGPPYPGANFPAVVGAPPNLVLKLALQRNVNDMLRLSIHGLWIQKEKGQKYDPKSAKSAVVFDIAQALILQKADPHMWAKLVEKWPSRDNPTDPTVLLVQQWNSHGCYTGLLPLDYFNKGLELYDEVTKLDPILGLSPGVDTAENIRENAANVLEKTYGTKAYPQVVCERRVDMTKPCRLEEELRICYQIGPRLKIVDCPTPYVRCEPDDDVEFE